MAKVNVKLKDYGHYYLVVKGPAHLIGMVVTKYRRTGPYADTIAAHPSLPDTTRLMRSGALNQAEVEDLLQLSQHKISGLPQ
jgi:hypothetical protein